MNAPHASAVLFDLDGTLVDSAPDIASSIEFALNEIGRTAPSETQVRSYIGNGAGRLIHRSLTGSLDGIADPELFVEASKQFFKHYAANVCQRSSVYPEVKNTLEELKISGFHLACVTNKPAEFTEPLLAMLGLKEYFSITMSGDTLANKKPAPDQLLHVATTLGVAPQNSTMIGDTVTDIQAAQNANMRAICVSYGYGSKADITDHSPFAIVDSIDQVVDILMDRSTASSCSGGG